MAARKKPTPKKTADATGSEAGAEHPERRLVESAKEAGEKLWLAGLGALGTAHEEGSKIFKQMVEKGAELERRMQPALEELVDQARGSLEKTRSAVGRAARTGRERTAAALKKARTLLQGEARSLAARLEAVAERLEKIESRSSAGKASKSARKPARRKTPRTRKK